MRYHFAFSLSALFLNIAYLVLPSFVAGFFSPKKPMRMQSVKPRETKKLVAEFCYTDQCNVDVHKQNAWHCELGQEFIIRFYHEIRCWPQTLYRHLDSLDNNKKIMLSCWHTSQTLARGLAAQLKYFVLSLSSYFFLFSCVSKNLSFSFQFSVCKKAIALRSEPSSPPSPPSIPPLSSSFLPSLHLSSLPLSSSSSSSSSSLPTPSKF